MTKTNILQVIAPKAVESLHIYRQVAATFAASLLSITCGITFGFTAVLLPQLESDPDFPYDKNLDSWIASISPLAMIMGCLFSGSMSDAIGRRMGQIVLIIPFIFGWVMMGLATDNVILLIGRFFTGVCTGAVRANTMVYISEVSDPKFRAIVLFSPSVALHVGSLISHTVGKYVNWKLSCFIFTIPNMICLVILIFLKESPLWLLSKGKIDEGIESFRQFRGNGESSEKELASILDKIKENEDRTSSIKNNLNIIFSLPFMKSVAVIFLLFIAVQWCGINTLSFYSQEIFEKTFGGTIDAFMLTLVSDCIRVLAGAVVCGIAKYIPRKITFVSCCFTTTLVLIALIVYLYLKPVGLVWLAITIMVMYISIASALTCISWSFVAEIFPAKVRGFGSGLGSAMSFGLLFISVKVAPGIMYNLGEQVMYGGFAGVTLISGILLCFVLPDTNGKSLQDIEDELYNKQGDIKKDVHMNTLPSNTQV